MRTRSCSRSKVNSPPSLPSSRIAARKSSWQAGSRTVLAARTCSTSTATPSISGPPEHLDVAQRPHRGGNQVLIGPARAPHHGLSHVASEHHDFDIHHLTNHVH